MKQSSNGTLRLAFGGFLAMAAAMGIGRFVYTPILPAMIEALDWSKVDAGLVASANFLGYLIGALVVGRRTFVTHPRCWLFVGLAVSAATTGAMALSADIYLLMVIRFASGIGSAFMIICASTLVLERLSAAGEGQLSFMHFAGVGAGIVMSATIVTALTAFNAGWQVMWLATGLVASLMSLIVVTLIPPGKRPEATSRPDEHSRGLPGLGSLAVAHGLFGFGYVITATFLVTLVRETVTIRALEPWIWVIVGCATIPSIPLWQWLGRRAGLLNAYALACLVEAVGVTISVEWVDLTGICVSAVLFGGTFMGLTAIGIMAARELSSGGAQWAIGLTTASFGLGQMIGPTVAGILSDQSGSLRSASFLAAGALVLAATLALRASQTSTHTVGE
jgi:MFS family permease